MSEKEADALANTSTVFIGQDALKHVVQRFAPKRTHDLWAALEISLLKKGTNKHQNHTSEYWARKYVSKNSTNELELRAIRRHVS